MGDLLTSSYKPKQQIIVYSSGNDAYLEYHDILYTVDGTVLSEGKPVTKKTLKKLLELVIESAKGSMANMNKLMPDNVLYFDPRPGRFKLIWYNTPMIRNLIGLRKTAVNIKTPSVLYVLDDDSLSIYALKSSRRPKLDSLLFHLPLPNIYDDGRICMGNVRTPKKLSELSDLIQAWEYAFWDSNFSSMLSPFTTRGMINQFIKSKGISTSLLKSTKTKLSKLIS
jgi:PRTRC genetic system protein B